MLLAAGGSAVVGSAPVAVVMPSTMAATTAALSSAVCNVSSGKRAVSEWLERHKAVAQANICATTPIYTAHAIQTHTKYKHVIQPCIRIQDTHIVRVQDTGEDRLCRTVDPALTTQHFWAVHLSMCIRAYNILYIYNGDRNV